MTIVQDKMPTERFRKRFQLRDPLLVNLLSELFATAILLFVGTGIVAQRVLGEGNYNTWMHINLGWGILVALCVYATFHTSGGHMNPAVSLAMVTLGKLSLKHFPHYCVAQTLGAFLGATMSYCLYYDQLMHITEGMFTIDGSKPTAGIFTSFPQPHISNLTAFFDQIMGTALLMFFIALIIDKRNRIPTSLQPLLFGFGLFVVGASYGMNTGYTINPARDLGPRLLLLLVGYGWEVFSWHDYYFWIPLLAPLIGGPLGAWSYYLFIGCHSPDRGVENGNPDFPESNGTQLQLKGKDEELGPLHDLDSDSPTITTKDKASVF